MNKQIVAEVRGALARHGKRTTAWEFAEIVHSAHAFSGEGMESEEAVGAAMVLVLRLYAVEDPPWSERGDDAVRGSSRR